MKFRNILLFCVLWLLSSCTTIAQQRSQQVELGLGGDSAVPVEVWPGNSANRILWLMSDKGFSPGTKQLATQLQRSGFEVWQADLLAAEFLSLLPSSIDKVDDDQLLKLVDAVLARDSKSLVLMADGHGARLVTRAARVWRNKNQGRWSDRMTATVLISPILYRATPAPGEEAEYIDSVGAAGGRQIIFQPQLSPYRWWIDRTVSRLKDKADSVTVVPLEGVRDRFYFRPDANAPEQKLGRQFGDRIIRALADTNR